MLINKDIKSLYKELKNAFANVTNKYDINLLNGIDTIITDAINEFTIVNSKNNYSIDSFITDFNDLLKVIRNNEDDLEDTLIEYMDEFIKNLNNNFKIVCESDGLNDNVTYISESSLMVYVDKLSCELGIYRAPQHLCLVEENLPNTFLNVFSNYDGISFYMITIDKNIIQFVRNISGNIFIKKIA